MKNKEQLKEKRLAVNIKPSDIKEIKRRALVQDMTLKDWVVEAIREKIRREIELGFE